MVVKELEMLPSWAGRAQEYDVEPPIDPEPEPAAVVVDAPEADVVDPTWPAPDVPDEVPELAPELPVDLGPEVELEPAVDPVVGFEPELPVDLGPEVELEPAVDPVVGFEPVADVEVGPEADLGLVAEHEQTVETPLVDDVAPGVFLGAETTPAAAAVSGARTVAAEPRRGRGRLLLVLLLLSIIAGAAAGYLYTVLAS